MEEDIKRWALSVMKFIILPIWIAIAFAAVKGTLDYLGVNIGSILFSLLEVFAIYGRVNSIISLDEKDIAYKEQRREERKKERQL